MSRVNAPRQNPAVLDPNAPVTAANRRGMNRKVRVVIDGQEFRVNDSVQIFYKGHEDATEAEVLHYDLAKDGFKVLGEEKGRPPGHEPTPEQLAAEKEAAEKEKAKREARQVELAARAANLPTNPAVANPATNPEQPRPAATTGLSSQPAPRQAGGMFPAPASQPNTSVTAPKEATPATEAKTQPTTQPATPPAAPSDANAKTNPAPEANTAQSGAKGNPADPNTPNPPQGNQQG